MENVMTAVDTTVAIRGPLLRRRRSRTPWYPAPFLRTLTLQELLDIPVIMNNA
jgi:hypothetical protein